MEIKRKEIINRFPWLMQKKCQYIVSSSYDGLICASFLNHFLKWELVGYYDFEHLWISKKAQENKKEIIWVDLNILPVEGRAIGGHIVGYNNEIPKGFNTSCNPNILVPLSSNDFKYKYPFSTIIFLMWLHNKKVLESNDSKFAILNADDSWLKYQKYPSNCKLWTKSLTGYDWNHLLQDVEKRTFEKRAVQKYYPFFKSQGIFTQTGKIKSKHYNISSMQGWYNMDWDEDIVLRLFDYFAEKLEWTPPTLPSIFKRIDGVRRKAKLKSIKEKGINHFIRKNKVFSYAITSNKTLSYTIFEKMKQNPIND